MEALILTEEDKLAIRKHIFELEDFIKEVPGHYENDNERCPLKHSFTDGIYVREIKIPKGEIITGKIHKHEHPNFLMSGTVLVLTENQGEEILTGPLVMISPPGTKRALVALTDLHWVTIHSNPTNTQDLKELEGIVIAKDYEEYGKFRKRLKMVNFIKKLLSPFKRLLP